MKTKFLTRKYMVIPVIILVVIILVLGLHVYRLHEKHSQEPISIMIATDMHLLAADYTGNYFYEPSAIFDGKLTHYSNEYFDAFLAEVLEKKPNLLILSGDLTLNGSMKSHEEMFARLNEVQAAGIQVLVIPGNHDIDVTAGDYSLEEPIIVESLDAEDFASYYENFGLKQAISKDEASGSYIYEASPYLRIIMLDTNTDLKGKVHEDTLRWLEKELQTAKLAGFDVISVSHQNLHIHNPMLYFTYQLYNADALYELYKKYDVDLSISGHIHVQSIVTDDVPEIVVGALAVPDSNYGQILYDGKVLEYTTHSTDVSSYAKAQGWTNPDLLEYEAYCRTYFEAVAKAQTYESYAESSLSQEDIALLAETFATINSAYFAGEIIDEADYAQGLALWRTQEESFVLRYIETMLDEATTDNRSLTIELD